MNLVTVKAVEAIHEPDTNTNPGENVLDSPAVLDQKLYLEIDKYRKQPGKSYKSLESELRKFVEEQFKLCNRYAAGGAFSKEVIEKQISENVPSNTYINNYRNGRPICARYTNTMANFFGVDYRISNFDPAKDFLLSNIFQS